MRHSQDDAIVKSIFFDEQAKKGLIICVFKSTCQCLKTQIMSQKPRIFEWIVAQNPYGFLAKHYTTLCVARKYFVDFLFRSY